MIKIDISQEFADLIRQIMREELNNFKDMLMGRNDETLMTLKETAEFMKVSTQTVRMYMRLGMPYFQEGQVIRFLKSDVIKWVKDQNYKI